jgi:hypothetical protein
MDNVISSSSSGKKENNTKVVKGKQSRKVRVAHDAVERGTPKHNSGVGFVAVADTVTYNISINF